MEIITSICGSKESTDIRVTTALNLSTEKLGVKEFINASGFVIDEMMFNEFWQVVSKNNPPHVGGVVLSWLGYEGEPTKQKEKLVAFLKRNFINYDEITPSDERFKHYPSMIQELATKQNQSSQIKFLIMNARDFKKAIMKLSTKRGDAIREYYLNVEELLQLYMEYEYKFTVREQSRTITSLERKIDSVLKQNEDQKRQIDELLYLNHDQLDQLNIITEQNNELQQDMTQIGRKLRIACVDRAPKPLARAKREKFVLIKWANLNYHRNLVNPRDTDNHRIYRYYAIRAQTYSANQSIREQRLKDPALEIILELEVQPNTKTLYNRIKEDLHNDGVVFVYNHISLTNSNVTETNLVERMGVINDDKFNV